MNCQKLLEAAVGSAVQADTKYVFFDADTIIYLAALRDAKLDLPLGCAEYVLKKSMARLQEKIESDLKHPVIMVNCLSTGRTFRHTINPDYKQNRKGKWKPPLLGTYIHTFKQTFPHILVEGYEADDLVGIMHTQIPGHILASGDKDLRQFSGVHWNPRLEEDYAICYEDAFFFRIYQWLVGDSADGYPGAYRVGDKGAAKFLKDHGGCTVSELVEAVIQLYETQNEKAQAKGVEPHDWKINFQMSQIRYEFNQEEIPDPVLFLQATLPEGQTNVPVYEI